MPPELMKLYKVSDLFRKRLQNDDVQDFDVRWDQALLSASEVPKEKCPGKFVQNEDTRFCSASDCTGDVSRRN